MSDEKIQFTRNYHDQSTSEGFQFEFVCDRCGSGFRTEFDGFTAARVAGGLQTASNLLGGLFGRAAQLGEDVRSAAWEKAHDKAFREAAAKLKPDFRQCPRCSSWVCRSQCWNDGKGLCKNCAPDLGVEMAAAQSSRTVEEIWAHSRMAEEDREILKEESWREGAVASCPQCEAPLAAKTKFCPECGAPIGRPAACPQCGAKAAAGAKFCGECGAKF
jgi:membrane protease subunit (stomatin/prohibitin family)